MASLERIEIHGFKSIEHLDLTLRPLNVLIGANGSGKSNFIGAFGLLNQIVEENLQVYVQRAGGADAPAAKGGVVSYDAPTCFPLPLPHSSNCGTST